MFMLKEYLPYGLQYQMLLEGEIASELWNSKQALLRKLTIEFIHLFYIVYNI